MLAPLRACAVAAMVVALGTGLSGCVTGHYPLLADRSDPAVRAEETRLQGLAEHSDPWQNGAAWQCRVRLMRQEASTSWAWTFCESTDTPGKFANAVRVDGAAVRWPRDMVLWDADIRRDFPEDLVTIAETGNDGRFATELEGS